MKLNKLLVITVFLISILNINIIKEAFAADIEAGEAIFNANCSACHIGGSNLIINDKTLKKDALETYGMNSVDAITTQVANGNGAMPAFGGRLNPEDIENVASYVLSQSEKGW
uniref:Cytochrome c6 n=1 Tax=Galaxaura rugosa TaxID=268570 RepID=A0A1G4NSR0_9FLOR|nr:Cytochrome c553 [Galaxaura rugosa]SCW21677.1 Cytochrome c553 [Galaxaura rugosa]